MTVLNQKSRDMSFYKIRFDKIIPVHRACNNSRRTAAGKTVTRKSEVKADSKTQFFFLAPVVAEEEATMETSVADIIPSSL